MRRDMDLVRDILLKHENVSSDNTSVDFEVSKHFPNVLPEVVEAHVELLNDAGFLGNENHLMSSDIVIAGRMTFAGYDYLDTVRDPEIWRKTKEAALCAGGFTMEILGDIAKGFLKTKIHKHTGVEI